MKILSSLSSDAMGAGASAKPRLRLYITVASAVFQPIIIYWLTAHLVRWQGIKVHMEETNFNIIVQKIVSGVNVITP